MQGPSITSVSTITHFSTIEMKEPDPIDRTPYSDLATPSPDETSRLGDGETPVVRDVFMAPITPQAETACSSKKDDKESKLFNYILSKIRAPERLSDDLSKLEKTDNASEPHPSEKTLEITPLSPHAFKMKNFLTITHALDQCTSLHDCLEVLQKNKKFLAYPLSSGALNKTLYEAVNYLEKSCAISPVELEEISSLCCLLKNTLTLCKPYNEHCFICQENINKIKELIPKRMRGFKENEQISIFLNLEMITDVLECLKNNEHCLSKILDLVSQENLVTLFEIVTSQDRFDLANQIVVHIETASLSLVAKEFIQLCEKAIELKNEAAFTKILSFTSFEESEKFSDNFPDDQLEKIETIVSYIPKIERKDALHADTALIRLLKLFINKERSGSVIAILPSIQHLPVVSSLIKTKLDLLYRIYRKAIKSKNEDALSILVQWSGTISHKLNRKSMLEKALESGLFRTVHMITATWSNIEIPECLYDEALTIGDEKRLLELLEAETYSFEDRKPLFEKLHKEAMRLQFFRFAKRLHLRWFNGDMFSDPSKHAEFIKELDTHLARK